MKLRNFVVTLSIGIGLSACQQVSDVGEKTQSTFEKVSKIQEEQAATAAAMNDAQKAYAAANAKMHQGMGNIPADADEAFMAGMIPHHQGAVDMAEIVLKHGKNPETRALAQAVIKAQKAEIAQMEVWLKKRGVKSAAAVDHEAMGH